MDSLKKIHSALISVYYKEGLEPLVRALHAQNVRLYSTGGTLAFIRDLNLPVESVESMTRFPEVFGGRVKTLHPVVFGGILNRRDHAEDREQKNIHQIPDLDLVVVDLYPFEETLASGASQEEVILSLIHI